jgi:ERCC4-type nuclease
MSQFTVLRDTREQDDYGYYFEDYPVDVKEVTLTTGDYAVQEPGHYGNNGTYHTPFAVERKAKGDLVSSISSDRDRFEREIERASDWEAPMPVIVEAPLAEFKKGNYYPDVHPNSIIGTVDKWPNYKNVDFFFAISPTDAERRTFEFLRWWMNRD